MQGRVTVGLVLACALLASPALAQPADDTDQVESGVAPGPLVTDPRPGEAFADPEVAKLQRTASDVQRELADLTNQIHAAEQNLARATETAETARAERARADAVVTAQQAEVDRYSAVVYATLAQPTEIRALLSADRPEDFLDGSGMLARLRADQDTRLAGAVRRQRSAVAAERTATEAKTEAGARKSELDRRNAVNAERARMARELHDVIANHLSAVALHSSAALKMPDMAADQVRQALTVIRESSVEGLAEMRRMIGFLRAQEGGPGTFRPRSSSPPTASCRSR